MGNSIHYFSHLCDRSSNKANEQRKDIFLHLFEGTVGDTEEDMVWGAALSCVSEYETEELGSKMDWVIALRTYSPVTHLLQLGLTSKMFHNLPKQHYQIGTNCLNTRAMGT